jgi:hypothetical protein
MTYKATGNTYMVHTILKGAGFFWDAKAKEWTGDAEALETYRKHTTPSWSGRNCNLHGKARIEFVEVDDRGSLQ